MHKQVMRARRSEERRQVRGPTTASDHCLNSPNRAAPMDLLCSASESFSQYKRDQMRHIFRYLCCIPDPNGEDSLGERTVFIFTKKNMERTRELMFSLLPNLDLRTNTCTCLASRIIVKRKLPKSIMHNMGPLISVFFGFEQNNSSLCYRPELIPLLN